jgi:hypothetical protein
MDFNFVFLLSYIIHICMEVPQGSSLCNYLKQLKMSFFFSYKLREQETEQVLPEGVGTKGWGGGGERVSVNIVQIPCAHVCKWKNETC